MKKIYIIHFYLAMLAVMSNNCPEIKPYVCDQQQHMATERDPGKERREMGIHPGLGRKRRNKKDKDDKTDPIFIKRTLTAGLCVLLGQSLLKKHTSHS